MLRLAESSHLKVPTLLHLAARYGLNELASSLVDFPGARLAYSVSDTDGNIPEEIAKSGHHEQLARFLKNFREIVSITDRHPIGRRPFQIADGTRDVLTAILINCHPKYWSFA